MITTRAVPAPLPGHHRRVAQNPTASEMTLPTPCAWTDVDGAEADEAGAASVNGKGAENVAAACAESGSILVHVSTDYVFSGDATTAYSEDGPRRPVERLWAYQSRR
jgi:RmlD substrate binding domain